MGESVLVLSRFRFFDFRMNENQTQETDDLCRLSHLDESIILETLKVKLIPFSLNYN